MKSGFYTILFSLILIPYGLIGQSISGQVTPCVGYTGYVYTTQQFMTNYVWTVSAGGTVTAGGSSTDYSITITWNTEGPQTVSVSYTGGTGTGVLNVTVQPTFPVSVSVSPSSNPVCAGAPVTFTANVINGGTSPVYSWFLNSVNVGVNNQTYICTPANNDIVHCQVISDLTCTTGNPATSPQVTMTITPVSPVNITVIASSNPSCQGDPVTFTATAINGGPSPVFQWKINGTPAPGATNSTYSYVPVNGDLVACQLTSSLACTSGNPVSSSPITMNVSPNQPVSVTISASANPVCMGSQVIYTASPVNGGSSPSYSWMINGINAGTNSPVMTWIPANGDVVICNLNSNAVCKSGNPAGSNEITMVVEPYQPVTVSIAASENPVCNGSPVTLTATPTNGGVSPHYQWTVNGVSIVHDNPVYTYIPTNGDIVLCYLTSSLLCPTGNPAISNSITLSVSPAIVSSVTITASANPTCAGTPITFTAHPVHAGTNPVFVWLVNGVISGNAITLTYTPVNGDVIVCQMTSSAMCSQGIPVLSNAITMTVSPALPVSVSIVVSANPVCQGSSVTFTAIPVNGGLLPVFEWKVNGVINGGNTSTFSYVPADGDIITCKLISSFSCAITNPATSNAITMTVSSSLPVGITIVADQNPSCQGQVVNFTAIPVNGGLLPVFTWLVNGVTSGAGLSTFSYTPTNGDNIICYLNSSYACASGSPATSNQITMTVNPNLPVSISIATLTNPCCQGTLVTYTATTGNGGVNPVFQWRVNGSNAGSNSGTFSYVPSNGNIIDCKLTSSVSCPVLNPVFSNAITQSVLPILPAGISISVSANPVCTGTQVTFTATPVNGGSNPTYQWKRNGNPVGSSPVLIYTPANGDVITCTLTSSLMCVSGNQITSNSISMVVSSVLIPAVTIAASANPFCQGSTVNFTSSISNGGSTPGYQWLKNGLPAGTSSTYSYSPADGDFITCRITSSLTCASPSQATSNPILMIRNLSTPVSVSITASDNPVCPGSTVTFVAAPTNGGSSPSYQWKVDGVTKGTNSATFTYSPINGGEIITCILTSNAPCNSGNPATSNPITMLTSATPTAGVLISTLTNPFCTGTSVAFTATASNGGSSPFYQWKVNGMGMGTNSPLFTYPAMHDDIVTCEMTSNASCIAGTMVVSDPPIVMVGSNNLPLGIMITESANPVCQGTAVVYTAAPVNGGSNPVFQWRVNNFIKGTNNPVYTYVPLNADAITCTLTSSMVCAIPVQKVSDPINMTVQQSQPVGITISASANPVCQGSPVTLTATPTNGGTMPVYQWRVNGVIVAATGASYSYTPVNGDVVTATLTSNAYCVSGNPAVSNSVTLVAGSAQPVSVVISASENPFCAGSQIVYQATPSNGGSNPTYEWRVNGVVKGTNNQVLLYSPVAGDQITCTLTSNLSCISNNPAQSNTITMVATTMMPVNVSIVASLYTCCAGTPVQFTASVTNGGSSPFYQWKVNGINKTTNHYIYQYVPLNGDIVTCVVTSNLPCATSNPDTSNVITMTVIPSAPNSISISESCNPCCQGTSVTYTAVATNPGTDPLYRWKVNGTILLGSGSTVFNYIPANGDKVMCRLTSNQVCATPNPVNSDTITMSIIPYGTVEVSITSSGNPVCQGTVVTYTAVPVNGGSAPGFQWKVNGINVGINAATYSYTPIQGDVVTCIMTSNASCVLNNATVSNPIVMSVSPLLLTSVYIVPSSNPVCQGSVTFNATPMNGGPSPIFQWKVNGGNIGNNSPIFTYAPSDGDVVFCTLSSNAACIQGNPAISNSVTLNVVQSLPVSVSVVPSSTPPCQGASVTFTATAVNGGANPTYQWMTNGIFVGGNSPAYTYAPNNGDVIECQVNSSVTCPTGNPSVSAPVTMNFFPVLPVSISISCTANPACIGPPVLFTANTFNAGIAPIYHWKVNGVDMGVNLPQFSYIPANGDAVLCTLDADIPCPLVNPVTSNSITMSVLPPQSAGITISTSNNSVCAGTLITFNSASFNQGSAPLYAWKVNGVVMGNNSTFAYIPDNGDVVTCQLTSSVSCITNNPITSNEITMQVSTEFPVSIGIAASENPSCLGQEITFTATPVNGGLNPEFQWMVNGIPVGTNSPVYSSTPSTGQVVTCQLISSYTCATGSPATSNPITLVVDPILPVGASIVSSLNPACLGTMVTYTSSIVNGGTSPEYHWKINGLYVVGSTNTYSYQPQNNDVVVCEVSSNEHCVSGNPANSNSISMIISTSFDAGVTIVASDNPICVSTPVTFTATPSFGGPAPTYQWKVNGVDVGSNNPVYNYYPNDSDIVTCVMTSALTCAPIPVTSNQIIMYVLPVPVSVTIAANPTTAVCAGTPVHFTAFPVNGGPGPTFQWKVDGNPAGTNSPDFTYSPTDGDSVICMLMSNATCASGSTAVSNVIITQVNPNLPVSISLTASSNPVCAGTPVTFSTISTNGGNAPAYQWKINGANIIGATNTTYLYVPVNNDAITCELTSNAICPTGNPAISNMVTLTVNPLEPVSISITASATMVCAGTPVTFSAIPANGGNTPGYQWKNNGANVIGATNNTYSYTPVNSDIMTCELTSNAVCPTGNPAVSNTVAITVNPMEAVSISITASAASVCAGAPVTFSAIATNGGSTPVYQWKMNGAGISGATNATYSYTPVNNDAITCELISNAICPTGNPALSNTVTITVNPLEPVSIAIMASLTTVCAGTEVTFSAIPANGGNTPVYQWKVNGASISGATNATYSYSPVNNDAITCELTSNATCPTGNPAISNTVTITVNPLEPVSISITASSTTVCTGTPVSFSALSANGGPSPLYQWKIDGINIIGATNTTYAYTPVNNNAITCELISSAICPTGNPATSNTVAITVNPPEPVSISITATSTTVCSGTPVALSTISTNGGSTPVYQWKVNGINIIGATNAAYSYTPVNNDAINCELTSNATCPTGNPATSNTLTITVNPLEPVSISITTSSTTVCAGTPVSFSASSTNGGNAPAYQWKVNGANIIGATNTTYLYIPVNNDAIICELISSAICPTGNPATSNAVTITVNPLEPVSISISASSTTVCTGTPVSLLAVSTNGGNTPAYQWKINGANIIGATNTTYSYIPVNNDAITCVLISNAICPTGNPAVSNTMTITVNPLEPVSITISATSTTVCDGTPVTFSAISSNGGSAPVYQWSVNGINIIGATNTTYLYIPVNNDAINCQLSSSATCPTGNPVTSNTVTITVNPLEPVSISITATSTMVCAGTPVTLSASSTNGGASPAFQWRINGLNIIGATNTTYSFTPVNNDAITCKLTSDATCPTGNPAISNTATITVNPLEPVSITITASATMVCAGTSVTFSAISVNGGNAPAYQWKVNGVNIIGATNTTYLSIPVNNDAINCELTSNATCPTGNPATSNTVTITVNPLEPVSISITASSTTVCAGTPVTLSSISANGGSGPVYQWRINGANVFGATNTTYSYIPVNNDVIACSLISNAICPTGNPATSNEILLSVNPNLSVSLSINATPPGAFCSGSFVTFNAAGINGGNNPIFQWTVNGVISGGNTSVFMYIPADGDIVQCQLTSSVLCAQGNPALSNLITMTVNGNFPVSISITASPPGSVCAGIPVTYTATPLNGGTNPQFQWNVNGIGVGANLPSYTYLPGNNDIIVCQLTSNLPCATNNPATNIPYIVVIGAAPVVTFTPCNDMVTTVNAKPFKLHGGLPIGGVYSGQGVNSVSGIFDPLAAGIGTHQITYTYTTTGLCSSSSFVSIINQMATPVICGSSILDYRDNKTYPTVQIGSQCWMASNLNFGNMINSSLPQVDNCLDEKYCLNNFEGNCNLYGGLYQWDELMRYDPVSGNQGFCPSGWHVPTDTEWLTLFNYYGGQGVAGNSLKGMGATEFRTLLGGILYQNNTWSINSPGLPATFFWTSDPIGLWQTKSHGLNGISGSVSDYHSARGNGFAVRCLRD